MYICGLNKTTLLDYPGKVAATIFLGRCNYRCPFCHNSSLISPNYRTQALSEESVFTFLKRRSSILDGVCITGGEPTLSPQLPGFLEKVRELGYSIKLDTNGTNPHMIKELVKRGLVNKIAMDIKTSPAHYAMISGVSNPLFSNVEESVKFLLEGTVDYEFRTTVVRELHTIEDFLTIEAWLSGAKAYYLQAYRDSAEVLQPGFSSYTRQELEVFRALLQRSIHLVEIRGID